MENLSDSSNKKNFLDLTEGLSPSERDIFFPYRKKIEKNLLSIATENDQYIFSNSIENKYTPKNVPSHWIEKIINSMEISTNRVFKKIKQKKKSIKQFIEIEKLNDSFSQKMELVQFCQQLFSLPQLKDYKVLHLLIHRKGNTYCDHKIISNKEHSSIKIPIDKFTTLFNSIKKSKDRSYGEVLLKGDAFNIIGTFLAYEFSFKFHSIIFILSREDFLPQSESEKSLFQDFSLQVSRYIEQILLFSIKNQKDHLYKALINNLAYPINIRNKSGEYLFSNTKKTIPSLQKIYNDQEIDIFSSDNSTQHLDKAQLYHQEKVSLLGELLNTLKHELSNPLFGLQLSSELLLLENLNKDQTEFIEQINLSIKRSQQIIENFNNLYSSSDQLEDIDIINILNEVFTLTKSESKHIKKEILLPVNTSTFYIKTNGTWIAQIFFNLILNSTQALSDQKDAQISFTFTQEDQFLKIQIKDNGPGIPLSDTKNIFEPFFTTKNSGTGLGLAICKNLAQKLKGDLILLPTGKGASFELILPYENTSH